MQRKVSLPLTQLSAAAGPPTVDAIRKRLGGRAAGEAGAGEIVGLPADAGGVKQAVVVCSSGDDLFVWVAEGIVRRMPRSESLPPGLETPRELLAIADDARVFGGLFEGQRVRYRDEHGELAEGTLVERCRFGALVLRADEVVVGVGFRRLWPASSALSS